MDLINGFFIKLNKLDELIRWGGYTILMIIVFAETGLFIGFFLPGDSLLVTAGLFAGKGDLDFVMLFLLLSAMAVAGDALGYWIGRKTGPRIFTREKSVFFAKHHMLAARAFFEKYGSKTIILARFLPLVRTFTPVVAGVGMMHYPTFFFYNLVGGILWVGSMLSVGFFLGRSIPGIESKIHWVILAVIAVSILPGIIEIYRHQRKLRK